MKKIALSLVLVLCIAFGAAVCVSAEEYVYKFNNLPLTNSTYGFEELHDSTGSFLMLKMTNSDPQIYIKNKYDPLSKNGGIVDASKINYIQIRFSTDAEYVHPYMYFTSVDPDTGEYISYPYSTNNNHYILSQTKASLIAGGDTTFFYTLTFDLSDKDGWKGIIDHIRLDLADNRSGCVFLLDYIRFFNKDSGTCGDNLTWELDSDGTLTIKGKGEMYDYSIDKMDGLEVAPWHDLGPAIKKVVVEEGVTKIGNGAFTGVNIYKTYENIEEVKLPNSLKKIGKRGFFNCHSLKNIYIPANVYEIGFNAFYGCMSMQKYQVASNNRYYSNNSDGALMSKNKTVLYQYPAGRTNFTYTVPSTVTTIENGAFYSTKNLTSVTISENVRIIKGYVFVNCTGLQKVTIPEGVTEIGMHAFELCNNLQYVVIPKSVDIIKSGIFANITTTPAIRGYSGSYAETYAKENNIPFIMLSEGRPILPSPTSFPQHVRSLEYIFRVVDKSGTPIEGATVSWTDIDKTITNTTNKNGQASIKHNALISDPLVLIYKDGYITWESEDYIVNFKNNTSMQVKLQGNSESIFAIKSAIYSNKSDFSNSTDVLHKTKKISLGSDADFTFDLDDGYFYLKCATKDADNTNIARYEVWQNNYNIAESSDGIFRLNSEDFAEGSGCFVRTIGDNNIYVDTPINLTFVKTTINDESSIDIGAAGISIPIGDNVPFFGGSTISLDWPISIPVTFKRSKDVVKIGFNWDVKKEDESVKDSFEEFKQLCDNAEKYGNMKWNENTKKWLSLIKEKNTVECLKPIQISVIGYAEANFGSSVAKGKLYIIASSDLFKSEYNTVLGYVPVTIQCDIGVSVEAGGEITYNWEEKAFGGSISISPSVSVDAFGGVGVSRFVGVGVYGSASLNSTINLIVKPTGVQNVDLTGELGIEAYVGWLKYEKPFAYNTWHLYTANEAQSASISAENPETYYAGLYEAENYKVADLSYMQNESDWLGDEQSSSLFAAEANTSFHSLLNGTYRNARPVMVSDENALYAAFVRADVDGNIYTALTKYEDGIWAEPVRVNGNAIYEGDPKLFFDENSVLWLAYSRISNEIDKSSLLEFAQESEIVAGTIDLDTLAFTQKAVITSENYVHSPELAAVNGAPALVYIESPITDENGVIMPESNTFFTVDLSSDTLEHEAFATVDMPIFDYAVGENGGEAAIACNVKSEEGEIVLVKKNGTENLATGIIAKLYYGKLPEAEENTFIWNDENVLISSDGTTVSALGITSEYKLIGNNIFYSSQTDNSANLFVVKYNDGNWGLPIQLTNDDCYLENISVCELNGTEYVMGMQTTPTISEDSVTDEKNLVWTNVMPVSDVITESVYYDAEGIAAGDEIVVSIDVLNVGDHEITSLDIMIDGETKSVESCSILPGAEATFETVVICPEKLNEYVISVKETDKDDYTPENNKYTVSIGFADLVLELEELVYDGNRQVVAYITNEGVEPASGTMTISYSDGTVIESVDFENTENGSSQVIITSFDDMYFKDGGLDITVTLTTDSKELYTYNNTDTIHLSKNETRTDITRFEISGKDLIAEISIGDGVIATAYIAEYDSSGKMIILSCISLTEGTNEIPYTVSDACNNVKLMVLDDKLSPLFEAKEISMS